MDGSNDCHFCKFLQCQWLYTAIYPKSCIESNPVCNLKRTQNIPLSHNPIQSSPISSLKRITTLPPFLNSRPRLSSLPMLTRQSRTLRGHHRPTTNARSTVTSRSSTNPARSADFLQTRVGDLDTVHEQVKHIIIVPGGVVVAALAAVDAEFGVGGAGPEVEACFGEDGDPVEPVVDCWVNLGGVFFG